MTPIPSTLRLGLLCGLSLLACAPALAQLDTYPSKPITLVVGYPPGGSTDLTGRTLGVELSKRLGVPVLIENIGGAGGVMDSSENPVAPQTHQPPHLHLDSNRNPF